MLVLTVAGNNMLGGVLTCCTLLHSVWFGLVWFYGISTIVGYLMSNPIFTYILNL